MALGTAAKYATADAIIFVLAMFVVSFIAVLGFGFLTFQERNFNPIEATVLAALIVLFGMLMGSRAVHGRELAVSPMECQINTQSTPDAVGMSKIVTLVRRTYVKSLRHGIYDHEDCTKVISDWVRSQPLPVR